jgi:hypothetical protein
MKAICINNVIGNKTYNLTIGKIYEVQLVKNSFIPDNNPLCWKCINDFMVMTIMPIDTFSEIDRYRNQRIDQLLK